MAHAFFIFLHIVVGLGTFGAGLLITIPVHLIYSAVAKKETTTIIIKNDNKEEKKDD